MQNNSAPDGDIVNWDEGLTRVAGNKALLEKLLKRVADELPGNLEEFSRQIAEADFEALSASVHSLKGSSGNLAIVQIFALSAKLERAANEADAAQASQLLVELKAAAESYISYVNG